MSAIISGQSGLIGTLPSTIQMSALYLKSSTAAQNASTLTIGNQWITTSNRVLLGGQLYWPNAGGGSQTIKVGFWQAGSQVDHVSLTVSAAGIYTVAFPSSHTVNAWTPWFLTMYRTDSAGYVEFALSGFTGSATTLAPPFLSNPSTNLVLMGPYLMWGGSYYSNGADVAPVTNLTTTQVTPLDPILDIS